MPEIKRKPTRAIFVGPVQIGGGAPVVVQSMTNTDTADVGATLAQIQRLAAAGCEVARLAVPDQKAAQAFGADQARESAAPDRRHPLQSPPGPGVFGGGGRRHPHQPRQPGGRGQNPKIVVEACRARGVPLRLGVNAGSLEADLLAQYGAPTAAALAASARRWVQAVRGLGLFRFQDFAEIVRCLDDGGGV